MRWTTQMGDAITYIEENLRSEIDYNMIEKRACCSIDTFQRIFSFIFDMTLSEYIRYRKLTFAAVELFDSDKKLIDMASKYGYSSHEAFSRAFYRFHGILPVDVKNGNINFKLCSKAMVSVTRIGGMISYNADKLITEGGSVMKKRNQPGITNKQFKLVGVNTFVKWGDDFDKVITEAEKELQRRIGDIKNQADPSKRIKYFYSETGMQEGFHYLECVEVTDGGSVPDGLLLRVLIPSDFAVFTAKPGAGGDYARNTWLKQSGYKENFDVFGDLEITNTENGLCEFWLPICRA